MQGLKTNESNKFKKFFVIVQNAAKRRNGVFFLDAGDGRDFETDLLEGEDLMGWLIPESKVLLFKKEWYSGNVSDNWSDYYMWAIWENKNNDISINFISFE